MCLLHSNEPPSHPCPGSLSASPVSLPTRPGIADEPEPADPGVTLLLPSQLPARANEGDLLRTLMKVIRS